MENWASGLAAISALFAAIAAIANLRQAKKASQGNDVNIYLSMLNNYHTEEMRNANIILAAFWREVKNNHMDIKDAFTREESKNTHNSLVILNACRHSCSYFNNAARLFEAGLVSQRLLKLMIYHPGLNVFYEVAVPIVSTQNLQHNSLVYGPILKKLIPKHGNGMY